MTLGPSTAVRFGARTARTGSHGCYSPAYAAFLRRARTVSDEALLAANGKTK